jgi:lipid-A-disaccharide synthase
MFVIFPFEKEFYVKHGVEVDFVGHPLLDELEKTKQLGNDHPEKIIALLPGSRRQEIGKMLPEYIKMVALFPEYKFVIAGISGLSKEFYQSIIGNIQCEIVWDNTYHLLSTARAAIVTSGTATLETALYNVPEVVCYKAAPISYLIARQLVKGIKYICIVNLIADREVVTELIQQDVNEAKLKEELGHLLDYQYRSDILSGYDEVRTLLGKPGASSRTADLIIQYMNRTKNLHN